MIDAMSASGISAPPNPSREDDLLLSASSRRIGSGVADGRTVFGIRGYVFDPSSETVVWRVPRSTDDRIYEWRREIKIRDIAMRTDAARRGRGSRAPCPPTLLAPTECAG